jgi:hypothetical protein
MRAASTSMASRSSWACSSTPARRRPRPPGGSCHPRRRDPSVAHTQDCDRAPAHARSSFKAVVGRAVRWALALVASSGVTARAETAPGRAQRSRLPIRELRLVEGDITVAASASLKLMPAADTSGGSSPGKARRAIGASTSQREGAETEQSPQTVPPDDVQSFASARSARVAPAARSSRRFCIRRRKLSSRVSRKEHVDGSGAPHCVSFTTTRCGRPRGSNDSGD